MDTVVFERRGQSVSVLGPEDDRWMDGLSVADVIRQLGIDKNNIITRAGKLVTPEGEDYEAIPSDDSGTSSSDESVSEAHRSSRAITDERKQLKLKLTTIIKKQAKARERGANLASRRRHLDFVKC